MTGGRCGGDEDEAHDRVRRSRLSPAGRVSPMSARSRRSSSGPCRPSSGRRAATAAPLRLTVAGRTDRGVHAWGQVASYAHEAVDPLRLNGLIGVGLAVLASEPVAGLLRRPPRRPLAHLLLPRAGPADAQRVRARSAPTGGPGAPTATRSRPARPLSSVVTTSPPSRPARPSTGGSTAPSRGPSGCGRGHPGLLDRGRHVPAPHEPRARRHDARRGSRLDRARALRASCSTGRPRSEAGPTAPAHGLALARVHY